MAIDTLLQSVMPERIRPEGERPLRVPEDAHPIGFFEGFRFFFKYVPEAMYSSRAIGYIYVKSTESDQVDFVQATGVRLELVNDLPEKETKRGLALDAIQRAKNRISNGDFEIGEVYSIELDEPSVERLM